MKSLITISSLVLLAFRTADDAPVIHKWKLTDLEGYISRADHPVILNFWATFCAPCVKEIPYFQSAVEKYKQEGVEMLLVSLDLPGYYPYRIAKYVHEHGYQATFAWLNETNADYFCPRIDKKWTGGIPSSLFINNRTHYRRFYDRQLTEAQVGPAIREMINPD